MKLRFLVAVVIAMATACAVGQIATDVIGVHDLGPGSGSPLVGAQSGACLYCHAPHSGITAANAPLWNQKLTIQTYTPYTSSTYHETGSPQPILSSDSNLCLSCHDGTVAPGTTAVYGNISTTGAMYPSDVFGNNLATSHPVSLVLPLVDAADLAASLVASGKTNDPTGAVKLVSGNIECTSCHDPHVQGKDRVAENFLVKNGSKGAICLACHDPNRVLQGQTNPLAGWYTSIHATATDQVQNLPYPTLDQNACENCHTQHNAPGANWILRAAGDQDCLNCHSGSSNTANNLSSLGLRHSNIALAPSVNTSSAVTARNNVAEEYSKVGHPLSSTNSAQKMGTMNQRKTQLLTASPNNAGLSGCIDCHDPHAVQTVGSFNAAPELRASQTAAVGVSENDGVTLLYPARTQFQTCLRCHGPSSSKTADVSKYGYLPLRLSTAADPRNVIPQFSTSAASSHPVFRPRSSPLPQPSLLVNMLNLNGTTPGRALGGQIFCTDCHNADDNREFGGTGPNGPHGSKWNHILERRYEFSQAPAPGRLITNLFPNPDLSINGPYALCGKCHNLSNVAQNASFAKHASHINAGFSCSTCHTAHGTGPSAENSSGERLINFDLNVVAPSNAAAISYNRGSSTCTLTCHNAVHNPDGSVTAATGTLLKKK